MRMGRRVMLLWGTLREQVRWMDGQVSYVEKDTVGFARRFDVEQASLPLKDILRIRSII